MIAGVVNAHAEAIIRLPVRAADGREQDIEAVLDTGFNGSLTLPPGHCVPWTSMAYPRLGDACQRY